MSGSPGVGLKFMPLERTETMAGVRGRCDRFTTDPMGGGSTWDVEAVGVIRDVGSLTWDGRCPVVGLRVLSLPNWVITCNRGVSKEGHAVRQ